MLPSQLTETMLSIRTGQTFLCQKYLFTWMEIFHKKLQFLLQFNQKIKNVGFSTKARKKIPPKFRQKGVFFEFFLQTIKHIFQLYSLKLTVFIKTFIKSWFRTHTNYTSTPINITVNSVLVIFKLQWKRMGRCNPYKTIHGEMFQIFKPLAIVAEIQRMKILN